MPVGLSFANHQYGVSLEILDSGSGEPAKIRKIIRCAFDGEPPDWTFEEEARRYHKLLPNELIGRRDTVDLARLQLAPGVYSLRLVYSNEDPAEWTADELNHFDADAPACKKRSNPLRFELRGE